MSFHIPLTQLQVESRFESEESRVHHYLFRETDEPLRRILQEHLLTAHLDAVITMPNSGLDTFIDLDRFEDLHRLYSLFTKVPTGLACLNKTLKLSVARRGRDINQLSLGSDAGLGEGDATEAKGKGKGRATVGSQTLTTALKWVQDVLDLKDKLDTVWTKSFESSRDVEANLNEVTPFAASWTQYCLHPP